MPGQMQLPGFLHEIFIYSTSLCWQIRGFLAETFLWTNWLLRIACCLLRVAASLPAKKTHWTSSAHILARVDSVNFFFYR